MGGYKNLINNSNKKLSNKKFWNLIGMPFFEETEAQKVRFLHFNIKKLEEKFKDGEKFAIDELDYILDYSMHLNRNYGNLDHRRILNELDITKDYIDPLENKPIQIRDLYFECARALEVLGHGYEKLSQLREEQDFIEDAVVAMVESSKIYKAAAYFSAAAMHQKHKGKSLLPLSLELKSEEARLFSQSISAYNAEMKGNLIFSSKLYSGLSALSKRLFYLTQHEEIKKHQLRAQMHFDMGKSCILMVEISSDYGIDKPRVDNLKQKAQFYFKKAKDIWEEIINSIPNLSSEEINDVTDNISVCNDILKEIKIEELPYEKIKKIQDPEPIIIIPENLAPFVPKATVYLSKIVPKDLNIERFKKFKDKKVEKKTSYSEHEELESQKFGVNRTLLELKKMKMEGEIGLEEYTEQFEKYKKKLNEIETKIKNLK